MAIGIVEIQNLVNAYKAYDIMVKTANISLIHHKKSIGGRLITLVFEGEVSDVKAAIDLLKKVYENSKRLKVAEVVANPAESLMYYFQKGKFYG